MEFCKITMNFPFSIRHSSRPRVRHEGERKSGMALVIVLGLVSLLLISSVAFAIMMRIERASSANARNTTIARQSAKNALAYAIAAIDQNIGSKKSPRWLDGNSPVWTYRSDPRLPLNQASTSVNDRREPKFWKDTFGSVDHSIITNFVGDRATARVLNGQMQHYLAPGISHRAWAQRYRDPSDSKPQPENDIFVIAPEWVPMTYRSFFATTSSVRNEVSYPSSVIGRSAFLAFDTSGYLDIPALCALGATNRAYGATAAEIKPVSSFFAKNANNPDRFKEDNKGRPFENAAEINKANPNAFSKGAAFSSFNFCPPERIPTNGVLYADYVYPHFPFRNKICIAGDGGDKHIESLRNHKAAIIAAFMQSGLTASSGEFKTYLGGDIEDSPCTDEDCTVCGGKASKGFTLKRGEVAEQALWAYLGLIDYIDGDDVPFYDEDIDMDEDVQQFARPNVENNPLFNGYVATVKFTRSEHAEEVPVEFEKDEYGNTVYGADGKPKVKRSEYVFDGTNAEYKIEVVAKAVFSNRCSHDERSNLVDGSDGNILERNVEAKLAFWFDGDDVWDAFVEEAKTGGATSNNGGTVFMAKSAEFGDFSGDKANTFQMSAEVKVKNKGGEVVADPNDADEKNEKFWDFPAEIRIGVAGCVIKKEKGKDVVVSRFPAYADCYEDSEEMAIEEYKWLVSAFNSEDEGASFVTKSEDGDAGSRFCKEKEREFEHKVYPTVEAARLRANEYKLKTKTVNLVLWGERLDPRFSCASAAETPGDPSLWPKTVLPSHINKDDASRNPWSRCALAHLRDVDSRLGSFDGADYFIDLMDWDKNADEFDDFVKNFSKDPEEFGDYFDIVGNHDLYPGCSALQKYLLTSKDALDVFDGVTDGSRRTDLAAGGIGFDGFERQFHSSFARNGGLDSAGELGFLPVGIFATIRLFGFDDERQFHKNGIDEEIDKAGISMFNQVTSSRPYHRVLDYFGNSYRPVRGRLNLNNCDRQAVASAFNGVAIDDYLHDRMGDSRQKELSEDQALKIVVPALEALLDKIRDAGSSLYLSDLGRLYDAEYYGESDFYEDFDAEIFNGNLADNQAREAMIRNTCGLFTTRGLNLTILLRGEAFTPFFGKSSVRNDLGSTLASRYALAQVWRDTEPDDDGKYPYFVQFFKIFDD